MRKLGVVLGILTFLVLMNFSFVLAIDCTSFTYSNWGACSSSNLSTRTVLSSSPTNCTGGSPVLNQSCTYSIGSGSTGSSVNLSKINKGFECLSNQVTPDCSGAESIQEIALTILATPNVTQKCVDRLKSLVSPENCFGDNGCNVRDTALAVLALEHVRENTKVYESWLLNHTEIATDINWYLEQDSNVQAQCKVTYSSQDYNFVAQTNKKLDVSAGPCLSLTQSDYWFLVSPSCYANEFTMVCDQTFIATLLYRQQNSDTIYVLSDTKSANANQPITLKMKSSCFGDGSCDYEGSSWATLALKRTGNNIDEFVPYLISNEDQNAQYLPAAFLNMIVDYSEYGTKLIQQQNLNSWEAEGTAYNAEYDTALAINSLGKSNVNQVSASRDWLLNLAQEPDGCWNTDNVRDTAMVLWSLEQRTSSLIPTNPSPITDCVSSGFFCTATIECDSSDRLGNYNCPGGLSRQCCKVANTQTCAEKLGTVCSSGKVCNGAEVSSSDSANCCLTSCKEEDAQSTCEIAGFTCRSSCTGSYEASGETTVSCEDSLSCCKVKTTPAPKGSLLWLWISLIILIILLVLAVLFRNKLKVMWYKRKSGMKDGENNNGFGPSGRGPPPGASPYSRPSIGPRPMPPQRIPMTRSRMQQAPQRPIPQKLGETDDVFKKLKEMGK